LATTDNIFFKLVKSSGEEQNFLKRSTIFKVNMAVFDYIKNILIRCYSFPIFVKKKFSLPAVKIGDLYSSL